VNWVSARSGVARTRENRRDVQCREPEGCPFRLLFFRCFNDVRFKKLHTSAYSINQTGCITTEPELPPLELDQYKLPGGIVGVYAPLVFKKVLFVGTE
jgi:hypothetical protein